MKHIKKFNEELSPNVYKRAGDKLIAKGHKSRGEEIIKYGRSKIGISDKFTLYSNGEELNVHWDYDKEYFKTDDNKKIIIGNISSQERRDSSLGLFYHLPEAYHNRFRITDRAYINNRVDAVRFVKFCKLVKPYNNFNINNIYLDNAEEVSNQNLEKNINWEKEEPSFVKKFTRLFNGKKEKES